MEIKKIPSTPLTGPAETEQNAPQISTQGISDVSDRLEIARDPGGAFQIDSESTGGIPIPDPSDVGPDPANSPYYMDANAAEQLLLLKQQALEHALHGTPENTADILKMLETLEAHADALYANGEISEEQKNLLQEKIDQLQTMTENVQPGTFPMLAEKLKDIQFAFDLIS